MPRREEAAVNRLLDEVRLERNRFRQRLTEENPREDGSEAEKESSRPIRLAEIFRNLVP